MLLDILRELEADGMPDFVKTAKAEDLDPAKLGSLNANAFADGHGRQYPVHTKAAAYVSTLRYLQDSVFEGKGNATTTANLIKFANIWGIADQVKVATDRFTSKIEPYVAPLPDDKFAFVYTDDAGTTHRRYPMLDAETIKQSSIAFFKERHTYTLAQRREIAETLHSKIAALNVTVGGADGLFARAYLDAMHTRPGCPGFDACAAIDVRRSLINDYDTAKELEKTAKAVRGMEALDPEQTAKLAELLDNIDTSKGLYVMYGKLGLKLPEDDLYASFKMPVDNPHTRVKLANGSEFDSSDFEKVGSAPFEVLPSTLDDVYVDGMFNVAAAIKTASELSREDASLFGRAMASALITGDKGASERRVDLKVEEADVPLAGLIG